jgi:hypothetical protein
MTGKHDLRGSVEPGHNVFGQVLALLNGEVPGEPKVTDFEVTALIKDDVGWLEVSMDNVS